MNNLFFKIILASALFFIINSLQAQETIPASGGDFGGNSGSISFTLGQIDYTKNSAINGSVAEGVQQPYEIWVYSGIAEMNGDEPEFSVFPNPASDILSLKTNYQKIENLSYQLFEMNGKLVENKKITKNETSVLMKNLAPGVFILKVFNNGKELKYFKIIKH